MTHWQHPRFHAYFPSGNSFPSILGDMLSDGIGAIGFSWVSAIHIQNYRNVCRYVDHTIIDKYYFSFLPTIRTSLIPVTFSQPLDIHGTNQIAI